MPNQSKLYYALRFLLGLGTDIIEPLILNATLKQQPNIPANKRHTMVQQEVINHVVGFTINNITGIGVGLLVEKLLKNRPNSSFWGIYTSLITETLIGRLLVMPYAMSKISSWWQAHHQQSSSNHSSSNPETKPIEVSRPVSKISLASPFVKSEPLNPTATTFRVFN